MDAVRWWCELHRIYDCECHAPKDEHVIVHALAPSPLVAEVARLREEARESRLAIAELVSTQAAMSESIETLRAQRDAARAIVRFDDCWEQTDSLVVRAEGDQLVIEIVDAAGAVVARARKEATLVACDLENGTLTMNSVRQ